MGREKSSSSDDDDRNKSRTKQLYRQEQGHHRRKERRSSVSSSSSSDSSTSRRNRGRRKRHRRKRRNTYDSDGNRRERKDDNMMHSYPPSSEFYNNPFSQEENGYLPPGVSNMRSTKSGIIPSSSSAPSPLPRDVQVALQKNQQEVQRCQQRIHLLYDEKQKYLNRNRNVSAQRNLLFSVLLVLVFFLLCIIWTWAAQKSSRTQNERRNVERSITRARKLVGIAKQSTQRDNAAVKKAGTQFQSLPKTPSLWATLACEELDKAQTILGVKSDEKVEKKRDPHLKKELVDQEEKQIGSAASFWPPNEAQTIREEASRHQHWDYGGRFCSCRPHVPLVTDGA